MISETQFLYVHVRDKLDKQVLSRLIHLPHSCPHIKGNALRKRYGSLN